MARFFHLLGEGLHFFFAPFRRLQCDIVSQREPMLAHPKLDLIVKTEGLKGSAEVVDLADHERATVARGRKKRRITQIRERLAQNLF
jgi:hypothetical protein